MPYWGNQNKYLFYENVKQLKWAENSASSLSALSVSFHKMKHFKKNCTLFAR